MKLTEIEKWKIELELATKYRDENFGKYAQNEITKAGENVDYYEKGIALGRLYEEEEQYTTLNLFHAIAKNVVPALYFKNPKINAVPLRREDEPAAPLAREIVNHYYREIGVEDINKRIIWDAYVLGYGVYKIGYATKYGVDVIDKKEIEKRRQRNFLERMGLKKPKNEEITVPELNYNIISESPYIQYLSPFEVLIDPRARNLEEAQWWAHCTRKTLEQVKANPKYKNTNKLQGLDVPDFPTVTGQTVPVSALDEFKLIDLYEIHYRNENKVYILVMAKDQNDYKALYHEESPYEIDGWQADVLTFNKHGHKLYPISDLTKIKALQDRFTTTMDSILNQIDRFVPKIAVDTGKLGDDGERTLEEGDVGAIVKCNGNPNEMFKELSFTQLKGDLVGVLDKILDVVTIQTGVTKAKLLGVSTAETATGEQLSHGAETLRLADMNNFVSQYLNRQATKLWQIVKQFAPFEDLQLITGESGVDPQTGQVMYTWLEDIDSEMSDKLHRGGFRFEMVVGSTQRNDIVGIRKQLGDLINIATNTNLVMMAQQQGIKVNIGEFLKIVLQLYPEAIGDVSKIIQTISQGTQGLIPPEEGKGGYTEGSGMNELRSLVGQPTPGLPQT